MSDFLNFGLSSSLMQSIEELGFETATPIQKKAIPSLIGQEQDFIGLAHTGTGKTAAFAIPLIENVNPDFRFTQAVVIAPTRELVKQIEQQILQFTKHTKGIKCMAVYGGTSISAQIKDLRKAPLILIATPGRLLDLIKRKVIVLKDVSTIVLDEADEMLNMGFKEDIDSILSSVKGKHNTWLFSATFPKEIRRISQEYMVDPLEFAVDSTKETNANIQHEYCMVKGSTKIDFLKRVMDANPEIRGIIFCRTKRGTQSLADDLTGSGYKVDALHGDMSQAQRERVMKKFRNYQIQVLVATDVAARGIDVKDLSHIIHYDIPDDLSYYTHRSGRTGRAGKKGISLVFVPPSQIRRIRYLERMLKMKFLVANIPSDIDIVKYRLNKWATNLAELKELENVDPNLISEYYQILGNFTKEELLDKMLSFELKKLNFDEIRNKRKERKERSDRGERGERGDRRDRGDRGERGDRRDRGDRRERGDRSERKERSNRSERPDRKDRSDRKDKRDGQDKSRSDRNKKSETPNIGRRSRGEVDQKENINFYINVGFIDGIGKRDLLTYLAEQTGLEMTLFRNLNMDKKHAYFDAPKKFEGRIISSFRSIRIGDRKLRVNRNQN